MGIEFEDGMEVEVFVDEYGGADVLDKLSAAGAVVVASLTEDRVSAFGETIEVEVPELVLIQFDFEQMLRTKCGVKVVDHTLLHVFEFHFDLLSIFNKFMNTSGVKAEDTVFQMSSYYFGASYNSSTCSITENVFCATLPFHVTFDITTFVEHFLLFNSF